MVTFMWFYIIPLVTGYLGLLVAILMAPQYSDTFRNVEQLLDEGRSFGTLKGTVLLDYLKVVQGFLINIFTLLPFFPLSPEPALICATSLKNSTV